MSNLGTKKIKAKERRENLALDCLGYCEIYFSLNFIYYILN
jgi:hypothetical protein